METTTLAIAKRQVIALLMCDDRSEAREILQRLVNNGTITVRERFEIFQECDQQAALNNQQFEVKS